tara:strand:+ start:1441 stop:1593 length:153 start_codon:yes stop_codon:yes gene_type:complete
VFTVLLSEKQKQNEERKDKVLKKNAAKIDVCFSFISFPGLAFLFCRLFVS